jgi:2-keto-4-pentenoate hydratase/2-oxohepta-3-ene-1,7-dioic acid hydratase in catechol pathway
MRIGNLSGRLTLFTDAGAVDVEKASQGQFGPDPQQVYALWDQFLGWATGIDTATGGVAAVDFDVADLGPPTPAPAQVFAVAANYHPDAADPGFTPPATFPPTFTKFRTSLSGPVTTVVLPEGGKVDWEVELVAVIGRRAQNVTAVDAWSYVAGLTAGQDLSERVTQLTGPSPQFSLGKSYPGFAPMGPWLVTLDEFTAPDDIELQCGIDGEIVQHGRTRNYLFSVPELIAGLSRVVPLLPGDVIFCGTPGGIGQTRSPQRFLKAGEELVSRAAGIGELRQTIVDAAAK